MDTVKYVVPDKYWKCHMSTSLRLRVFKTKLANSVKSFKVLCKIDASLSPRDLTKLKTQVVAYTRTLANEKLNMSALIYCRMMKAVYEKQLAGMG